MLQIQSVISTYSLSLKYKNQNVLYAYQEVAYISFARNLIPRQYSLETINLKC